MIVMVRRFVVAAVLIAAVWTAAPARAADTLNCSDFPSQAAAQQNLRDNPSDPNRLDANHNGVACEAYAYPKGSARDVTPVVLGSSATTPTTASTTVRRSTATPNTGPVADLFGLGAAGIALIVVGARMRGRRTPGMHWA